MPYLSENKSLKNEILDNRPNIKEPHSGRWAKKTKSIKSGSG